jgi:hypothetical protein
MTFDNRVLCRPLVTVKLVLSVLVLLAAGALQGPVSGHGPVRINSDRTDAAQASNETKQFQTVRSDAGQEQRSDRRNSAPKTQSKKSDGGSKSAIGPKDNDRASSIEERKREALTLLENLLLGVDRISPVEYKVLFEIEAATILWESDRQRAVSILKAAIGELRRILGEKKESTEINSKRKSREQMVWFLAIRKIAALQPGLVRDLLSEGDAPDKPKEAIKGVWTEEARAMLSVASELIDKDPRLAAQMAEQTLPLGLASYLNFLQDLARRDNTEAERLGTIIIDRLRDSPITPIQLRNMSAFFSASERTARLRTHFYQALLIRLRRELRPDITGQELADALGVARGMARQARSFSAYWQQEFENTSLAIERLFSDLSLALPIPPDKIVIDTSQSFSPAIPGVTQDIRDALAKVGLMGSQDARNREYQRLAGSAARSADKSLAEEIMSRISDDAMRHETTTLVYSPLVRTAINDSAWGQAQQLASSIQDPLARTLVFCRIAQEMTKAGQHKSSIIDAYSMASGKLYRDEPTDRVAKSYLLIARPLLDLDRDRGVDAIRTCATLVSNLSTAEQPLQESAIGGAASMWIRYSNPSFNADEVLNLAELVTTTFAQIAGRDTQNALEVTAWINHRGMYALAQLAVVKVLLYKANTPPRRTTRKEKANSTARN